MTTCDCAFNQGSDARIAGRPLTCNPYHGECPERSAWMRGWRDVEHYWGTRVTRRTVRPLPEVLDPNPLDTVK